MENSLDPDINLAQVLPIQQKRIVTFVNQFVMDMVSFLNTFGHSCESRLMEFEFKLQKLDASLIILESQLSSIPFLNEPVQKITDIKLETSEKNETLDVTDNLTVNDVSNDQNDVKVIEEERSLKDDPIYSRFFKMVQVGVPLPAVKLKMQSEGLDPNVLDK